MTKAALHPGPAAEQTLRSVPETRPSPTARPLEYLPVALFGSVMGLTGLSVAWHQAAVLYGASPRVSDGMGYAAIAAFVVLAEIGRASCRERVLMPV